MTSEGPARRILVVDDDEHTRNLLRDLCEQTGYEVACSNDGVEAMETLAQGQPDLVLLDLMMPRKDGFSVLKALREAEATRELPVIILTAIGDMDGKIRGMELGADDYVTKPFKLIELQTRIKSALLVREYRHPLGSEIFNIPAGGAGHVSSEDELVAHAARELAEETCLTAREWTKIGMYHPVPAMSPALHHVYLARGLEPVSERGTGADWCEIEEVVRVPFRELYEAAVAGEITDGLTLLALLWAGAKGLMPAG